MLLKIADLYATINHRPILQGIDLAVRAGEVHAIMGPNGAGKSTFAKILAGDPAYETTGSILLDSEDIGELPPEVRAHKGLFLGFQYPIEIPGITNFRFLHAAYNALRKAKGEATVSEETMSQLLAEKLEMLKIHPSFLSRGVNEGFSGGEKKRNEILQMALLNPKVAVLDETDSGLDIDALKGVAEGLCQLATADNAYILITHYQRLLDHIVPDFVHVMIEGRIVASGGPELAKQLEVEGYDWLINKDRT
jgi:Fe-S cluster assembly ATP-binding protein